jgi:hypothetical protein
VPPLAKVSVAADDVIVPVPALTTVPATEVVEVVPVVTSQVTPVITANVPAILVVVPVCPAVGFTVNVVPPLISDSEEPAGTSRSVPVIPWRRTAKFPQHW